MSHLWSLWCTVLRSYVCRGIQHDTRAILVHSDSLFSLHFAIMNTFERWQLRRPVRTQQCGRWCAVCWNISFPFISQSCKKIAGLDVGSRTSNQMRLKPREKNRSVNIRDGSWWIMMDYNGIWMYMNVYDGICMSCMYMSVFLSPFYREWVGGQDISVRIRTDFSVWIWCEVRTDPYGISFLIYVDSSWIYLR